MMDRCLQDTKTLTDQDLGKDLLAILRFFSGRVCNLLSLAFSQLTALESG